MNRARNHFRILQDAKILWVDDQPDTCKNEREMFAKFKVEIDLEENTLEAMDKSRNEDYDLVISDMARGTNTTAGFEFLQQFRDEKFHTPVIFYVGVFNQAKGVPGQAFGITNRPDELLHLVLDSLERKKY